MTKDAARRLAYQRLHEAKAARFPFPIEGRIPNFKGAEAAARLLRETPFYRQARVIKVNPDAPQLPVRAMALADGKTLILPSPRLKSAFIRISPLDVPKGQERKAAAISHWTAYGQELGLEELEAMAKGPDAIDLFVAGSVAVSRLGARAGKGEGYADLEYALWQELGLGQVPVVTTVHDAQIVPEFDIEPHDLSVDYIVTPQEVIATHTPYPKPARIDWSLLDDWGTMPLLSAFRESRWHEMSVPDVLAPGLDVLFVGLNPGRYSAAAGHHFAGPGNFFWKLLRDSGLTPIAYRPQEERKLLGLGLGITNLVSRASRSESDLTWDEMLQGGALLREKIAAFRPRIAVLLGKGVYRAYAGLKASSPVEWGLQARQTVSGVVDFVAPNPSPRSTLSYSQRLEHFRALNRLRSSLGSARSLPPPER